LFEPPAPFTLLPEFGLLEPIPLFEPTALPLALPDRPVVLPTAPAVSPLVDEVPVPLNVVPPPAVPFELCASTKVLDNANAVASAIVANFINCPLMFH
jgi:hypothetical protein